MSSPQVSSDAGYGREGGREGKGGMGAGPFCRRRTTRGRAPKTLLQVHCNVAPLPVWSAPLQCDAGFPAFALQQLGNMSPFLNKPQFRVLSECRDLCSCLTAVPSSSRCHSHLSRLPHWARSKLSTPPSPPLSISQPPLVYHLAGVRCAVDFPSPSPSFR